MKLRKWLNQYVTNLYTDVSRTTFILISGARPPETSKIESFGKIVNTVNYSPLANAAKLSILDVCGLPYYTSDPLNRTNQDRHFSENFSWT